MHCIVFFPIFDTYDFTAINDLVYRFGEMQIVPRPRLTEVISALLSKELKKRGVDMRGFQKMTSKTLRGGVARQITLDVHVQSPSLLNIDHNSSLMLINHFLRVNKHHMKLQ